MCLIKIHGEEMPGDVESIGAEGGVTDMDNRTRLMKFSSCPNYWVWNRVLVMLNT
jgi:hypothetical protein